MNRIALLSAGLLLTQPAWAQLYNATPNQTQSFHDANSIELGDGFSSTGEISITIDAPPNTFGQWAAEPNWGVFIGIHTSVLPNGNVLVANDAQPRVGEHARHLPGVDAENGVALSPFLGVELDAERGAQVYLRVYEVDA